MLIRATSVRSKKIKSASWPAINLISIRFLNHEVNTFHTIIIEFYNWRTSFWYFDEKIFIKCWRCTLIEPKFKFMYVALAYLNHHLKPYFINFQYKYCFIEKLLLNLVSVLIKFIRKNMNALLSYNRRKSICYVFMVSSIMIITVIVCNIVWTQSWENTFWIWWFLMVLFLLK